MNINLGVVALSARGRRLLPALWRAALEIGEKAYNLDDKVVFTQPGRAVINARSTTRAWDAPTWIEDRTGILSLSQPPVSFTEEVSQSSWRNWARDALRADAGRRTVQPGYFGLEMRSDGTFHAWNDLFGFGRAYVVENDDFLAVGNHIGMTSMFVNQQLEVDMYGCDVLAQIGFWPEDVSPVSAVRRLGPAEVVSTAIDGSVRRHRYATDDEFYGYRESEPSVRAVADSLAVVTANGGEIAMQAPTVYLSGGQDSRVTAAAWIVGGKPAIVQTTGTLQGEVDIARQLMSSLETDLSLDERGLTYKVTEPNPARLSTYTIEDRLSQAMLMWDGDFAPANLKAALRRPGLQSRLTVGGANGEVMHGIYYSNEKFLRMARDMPHPVYRVAKSFSGRANTERSRASFLEFVERQVQFARELGQLDATALNVFQMHSKFRRWINAQLSACSFVLLLNPVFVRNCIDLTPEQRLSKEFQRSISRELIPQWESVPYYKATLEESTATMKKRRIRTWDTSVGSMERLLHERTAWQQWFDPSAMATLEHKVHSGEGTSMDESTLNKAYVLDGIPDHVSALERRRSSIWSGWPTM